MACGDAARITIGRILIRAIDSKAPREQPALLERGSFPDGSMHGGNQPTNISLIHRRSSRLVPHHPRPLAKCIHSRNLTRATISVQRLERDSMAPKGTLGGAFDPLLTDDAANWST